MYSQGGDLFTVGKTIGPFFRAQNHANPESPPRWHPIGSKRMIRSTKGYTEEIRLRERSLSALKKTIHAKDGLEAQGLILRIDPIPLATSKFIQIWILRIWSQRVRHPMLQIKRHAQHTHHSWRPSAL